MIKEECVSPAHYLNIPTHPNQRFTPSPESFNYPLPDMQAIQQNVFAGDQSMYASSIPHTQPQNLPRFESIPKLSMTPDTEFADVILNQIGFCENSENRRTVAENTQPENLPDDDVEHGGIISDLDLNQISMTDSDIIRFMQNTIPMETAQSMEENMSDSLSQLRIQRSP